MAGKIQLTPAELLAQSQEMLSLQKEFESLFSQTNTLLGQVNQNWSAALANNFAGKLTNAQKGFANIVSMLQQGSNLAATSAKTYESIDNLLAKNMGGDGWSVAGGAAAGIAGAVSGLGSRLAGVDLSAPSMSMTMAANVPEYEDQNILEFIFSDFERNSEIWEDFGKDILKMFHIDINIGQMIIEDIKNGEFNKDTLWKIGSEIANNWTEGKIVVGTLENVKQLIEQSEEDQSQTLGYFEEGNILAGANTMIGSAINCVIVGSIDVAGDIVVNIWDDFPGTNMLEHVFGVDVSKEWESFTKWAHEGVDNITEATSEFIADVEEGTREVVDNVIDFAEDLGEKASDFADDVKDKAVETVEAIGDGIGDAADAVGDWVKSWW